jgi:hypothetical protein
LLAQNAGVDIGSQNAAARAALAPVLDGAKKLAEVPPASLVMLRNYVNALGVSVPVSAADAPVLERAAALLRAETVLDYSAKKFVAKTARLASIAKTK